MLKPRHCLLFLCIRTQGTPKSQGKSLIPTFQFNQPNQLFCSTNICVCQVQAQAMFTLQNRNKLELEMLFPQGTYAIGDRVPISLIVLYTHGHFRRVSLHYLQKQLFSLLCHIYGSHPFCSLLTIHHDKSLIQLTIISCCCIYRRLLCGIPAKRLADVLLLQNHIINAFFLS